MTSSEHDIQNQIRIAASAAGWRVWRNNVGVLIDKRGVPVRYGLANDSAQVNKQFKSGDLIGIRPVLIAPEHVGHTIGQFVSLEVKRPDWRRDDRTDAQEHWRDLVLSLGGYAKFTTGEL
jgi:hypothetical protein